MSLKNRKVSHNYLTEYIRVSTTLESTLLIAPSTYILIQELNQNSDTSRSRCNSDSFN
ncbi:hypothetical protein SynRS9902_02809 [Synechococcus sp. RS9902]|nr:hypothetical protein SynRS9902_02809 [Synechococcus sp. RS9902]